MSAVPEFHRRWNRTEPADGWQVSQFHYLAECLAESDHRARQAAGGVGPELHFVSDQFPNKHGLRLVDVDIGGGPSRTLMSRRSRPANARDRVSDADPMQKIASVWPRRWATSSFVVAAVRDTGAREELLDLADREFRAFLRSRS